MGGATWLGAGTFCCACTDDGNSATRAVNATSITLGKYATDIEYNSPTISLINGYREKDKPVGLKTAIFLYIIDVTNNCYSLFQLAFLH